ncbi:hypothetical protein [Azospirillum largimobile]
MEHVSSPCFTVPSFVPAEERRIRHSVVWLDMRKPPSSGIGLVPSGILPTTDGRRQ